MISTVLEVAVGRGHDANVDLDRLAAADALELALLQHAQQLDLHVGGQIAHLVEEQGAAVGHLEAPQPPRHRTREGSLLVTEQLGFEDARCQRGAVDAHERARFARAVDVDRARDHLLAGAGLAAQQDRRRRLRDLLDAREHLAQRRRFADDGAEVELVVRVVRQHADVGRQLLGEPPVLAHQREALDRVGQHAAQLLRIPRLGHVTVDAAEVDRLDQHVDVRERGDDDADRVGPDLARRLQQVEARHLRHPLIGDDRRDVFGSRQRQRFLAAAGEQQLEAASEVETERVQVVGLVVDHQHGILRQVQPLLRHDPDGSTGARPICQPLRAIRSRSWPLTRRRAGTNLPG